MDNYFPLNRSVQYHEVSTVIKPIVLYLVICLACGIVNAIFRHVPVLGWVLRILTTLIGIYCLIGIILSVLKFVGAYYGD